MARSKKKNTLKYNLLFLVVCGGLFLFLWSAPPETTAPLPRDRAHARFMPMEKKQAERHCQECHAKDKRPLP
ncbi:MAG: hypothetical protein D3923_16850, partial [Candidatus Electrothrix sp. AR3]|nr:hypothetical protein [Candidatus Electrothrix sp. AR3]